MKTHEPTKQPMKQRSATKQAGTGSGAFQLKDNRPQTTAQLKLQETMQNNSHTKQLMGIQKMAGEQTVQRAKLKEEKKPMQGKFETAQRAPKEEEKKKLPK